MIVPSAAEKERAKRIIVEIIRQAGGSFTNKTNLYKAFYYAHLKYAEDNPGFLSTWPIVRMPNGPGIDNFDTLVGELLVTGRLHCGTVKVSDDKEAFRFELTDLADTYPSLPATELAAIQFGVEQVLGKTAALCSEESHSFSRSWRSARNGDELDIYLDLMSDSEFEELRTKTSEIAARFRLVAG